MTLAEFLNTLFHEGKVVATGDLSGFDTEDRKAALDHLQAFYRQSAAELPGHAPPFDAETALAAAEYLYRTVQLIIDRTLDEEAVSRQLPPLPEPETPGAVYAADLSLRYLPELFDLAKGLAPLDILVAKLRETAAQWPFSSVGIELPTEYRLELILQHPALALAYTDRVMARKDLARAQDPRIREWVAAALGGYGKSIWPEF